jgi:fructuronate reductase
VIAAISIFTKLRMLNGTHSLLAYWGALHGLTTIADAVTDEHLASIARGFLFDEVIPTLTAPDGLDLAAYAESLLERFANPGTRHSTIQVAMDGSKKLPIRLFGTVSDLLARGVLPIHAAQAFAAWIVFVAAGRTVSGEPLVLDDPRAAELAAVTGRGSGETPDAAALVAAVLALPDFVPAAVSANADFTAAVTTAVEDLLCEYRA